MNQPLAETDHDWAARERYWRTKLRRLRFDAEPIPAQLERQRRAVVALTVVSAVVSAVFLFVFTAFRRPDIAGLIILCLFAPILGIAWLDFHTLRNRAAAYEAERKKTKGPS